jgi:hypothetical protein
MRAIRSALIGFLVFGSLGCATSLDPAKPPPRGERPTYSLGEKWIRNDGVYELIRIEDDRYIFSAGRDREIQLTRDLFPATVVKGVRELTFSPPPRIPWPLEVGKAETGSAPAGRLGLRPAADAREILDSYPLLRGPRRSRGEGAKGVESRGATTALG